MQGGHGYEKHGKVLKNEKVDQKLGPSEKCVIGPSVQGDYYKIAVSCVSICLSVHLSVFPSVWHFSQEWLVSFFMFKAHRQIIEIFKSGKSPFFWKIHFPPNLGKKTPKWPQNKVILIFDEVGFLHAVIIKADGLTLGVHSQACPKYPKQNNKFTISLQYLKKSVKDEVNFLPANTRRRFLQIDAIILGVVTRHAQIIQNNKFAISLQCLKKKVW